MQFDAQVIEKTRLIGRDCYIRLVLNRRRCDLSIVFLKRQHHGHTVTQGEVIPGNIKPLAALVGPDRADARPDLLPVLVFARAPTVVEDICWCVRHRNAVSATAFSVWQRQRASIQA